MEDWLGHMCLPSGSLNKEVTSLHFTSQNRIFVVENMYNVKANVYTCIMKAFIVECKR